MYHPSLNTPPDAFQPQHNDPEPPTRPSGRAPVRRLWHSWLWLTGPRPDRFGEGVVAQERLRRSRLISFLLILVAITILLLIPAAFSTPGFGQVTLVVAALGVLATLFNRVGWITAS